MAVLDLRQVRSEKKIELFVFGDRVRARPKTSIVRVRVADLDKLAEDLEIPFYRHVGPVMKAFHASNKEGRFIMGPIGSGKTSAGLTELWLRACRQKPNSKGVRYSRWGCVRDTYPNLKKVIESWEEQPISQLAKVQGGINKPGSWHVRQALGDGTWVDIEIQFHAIGKQNVEQFFRGLQVTGMLFEEADTLPPDALDYALGRLGRFPNNRRLGYASWQGVICIFNAPDMDNWIYKRLIEQPLPDDWDFFIQPGGMEAGAENLDIGLKNLGGRKYYSKLVATGADWWVRRMIHNQFGFSRAGKPCYPDFDQTRHVSLVPLEPIPGVEITVGLDQGRTPAAIFMQRVPVDGQIRVLAEMIGEDVNAVQFGKAIRRFMDSEYPGYKFKFVCDPAAKARSSEREDDARWLDIVGRTIGVRVRPARTNAISVRLAAVTDAMTRPLRNGRFGLIFDPRCKMLIQGAAHGYHFRAIASAHGKPFDEKPDKNKFADPHDGLQYGVMEVSDVMELGLKRRTGARPNPADNKAYHPHDVFRGAA